MQAKFVRDSLNEGFIFSLSRLPQDVPVFKTMSWAIVSQVLENLSPGNLKGGKIDLSDLFRRVRVKGFKGNEEKMREVILEAAPFVDGLPKYLKLAREERSDLNFKRKFYNNELDLSYFLDAEIDEMYAGNPKDYSVRDADRLGETAYYRFYDEDGEQRTLNQRERNMLRGAYAEKYCPEQKSRYQSYLDARPITLGFAEKHNRDLRGTRNLD